MIGCCFGTLAVILLLPIWVCFVCVFQGNLRFVLCVFSKETYVSLPASLIRMVRREFLLLAPGGSVRTNLSGDRVLPEIEEHEKEYR